MFQESEYGWFSDIETNPDIIYVEYKHVAEKGIYKVRNVHIEFPPPPIEISLTGESLSALVALKNMQPPNTITFEDKSSSVIPRTPTLLRSPGVLTNAYSISQTHYIDVPHIIYINEHPSETEQDNQTTENIHEVFLWYNNCVQNVLYILTALAIILVCCG
jgi:hypothetical protein